MGKRFTDTGKWKKAWYRKLGSVMRDVWNYLLDNCDMAGVWEVDWELLSFFIGEEITLDRIQAAFGDRIVLLNDNKLFISDFIEFQYGELSVDCKPHQSVIKRLRQLNIDLAQKTFPTLTEEYAKGCQTLEDKEKDKEKDQEEEKEKEKKRNLEKNKKQTFDFNAIYQEYPLRAGKQIGLQTCRSQIKTQGDYDKLLSAVRRYRAQCEREGTEKQFIKHFSTFMHGGKWKDFLDPDVGTSTVSSAEEPFSIGKILASKGQAHESGSI